MPSPVSRTTVTSRPPRTRSAPADQLLRRREGDPKFDPQFVRDLVHLVDAGMLLDVPVDQPDRLRLRHVADLHDLRPLQGVHFLEHGLADEGAPGRELEAGPDPIDAGDLVSRKPRWNDPGVARAWLLPMKGHVCIRRIRV